MKMQIEDYLYSLRQTPEEYEFVSLVFLEAQKFILFLKINYPFIDEDPVLFANTSLGMSAETRRNEITLSRGMINFCQKHSKHSKSKSGLSNKVDDGEKPEILEIGGLLWIIAHEFFHYVKQHGQLRKNHASLAQAFEYDADCMAVAGIYLYFQKLFGAVHVRIEIKFLVLEAFYWPVRELISASKNIDKQTGDHPNFYTRLNYSIQKLVNLDIPHENHGITPTWEMEYVRLANFLLECENNYYFLKNEDVRASNYLIKLLAELESGKFEDSVYKLWRIAEPLIKSKSLMVSDICTQSIVVAVRNGRVVALFRGWVYSSTGIKGYLIPAFHNRPSKTKNFSFWQTTYRTKLILDSRHR